MHDDTVKSRDRSQLLLTGLIICVALLGVAFAYSIGRIDTALLFVGIPCLMAFGFSRLPTSTDRGRVFKAVTIALLLASGFLHEGAICVLIASPLIYGAVGGVLWLIKATSDNRRYALAFPLLAALVLEGVLPGWRINPEQVAQATQFTAQPCSDVLADLDNTRQFSPNDRGLLLRLTGYATPLSAQGTGTSTGDTWRLDFASGAIDTSVERRTGSIIEFQVTDDTSKTARFVRLKSGELSWQQSASGCELTMQFVYDRNLDPSLWFGPITDLMMDQGAAAFLRGLSS